jgi:hypothetical protein
VYAGDGGWVDRSRVDAARGADVSGATMVANFMLCKALMGATIVGKAT